MLLIDWIAVVVGVAMLAALVVRTLQSAVTRRDWPVLEAGSGGGPPHLRRIVSASRLSGVIVSLLCLYCLIRTPIAAVAAEGGWPLATACAVVFGILLCLSIRWTLWAWRTQL